MGRPRDASPFVDADRSTRTLTSFPFTSFTRVFSHPLSFAPLPLSIFTMVVMLRSRPALEQPVAWSIVGKVNLSDVTRGRPPEFIGLQASKVGRVEASFVFTIHAWTPKAGRTPSRVKPTWSGLQSPRVLSI